jgi:hypothetical protein
MEHILVGKEIISESFDDPPIPEPRHNLVLNAHFHRETPACSSMVTATNILCQINKIKPSISQLLLESTNCEKI